MKTEEMSIELVIAQTPTVALLDPKKKEELYAFLEREIAQFVPDLSTETTRKQIASLAYKVSRTKAAIDDAGALLKSEWLKKSQEVDKARKEIREKLDMLRDRARKPLTDWEEAEDRRQAAVDAAFDELRQYATVLASDTGQMIAAKLNNAETYPLPAAVFQDRFSDACTLKATVTQVLREALKRAEQAEHDAAELARLRMEAQATELARLTKEREEREAQRLRDMETARKAEEARQVAIAEQAKARHAQEVEAATKEAAERERLRVSDVAERRLKESEAAHRAELEKARKAQEAAESSQREAAAKVARDEAARLNEEARLMKEAENKAKEEAKIAANKKHRAAVMTAAKVALIEHCAIEEETARKVVLAISAGKIPAVSWSWIA